MLKIFFLFLYPLLKIELKFFKPWLASLVLTHISKALPAAWLRGLLRRLSNCFAASEAALAATKRLLRHFCKTGKDVGKDKPKISAEAFYLILRFSMVYNMLQHAEKFGQSQRVVARLI